MAVIHVPLTSNQVESMSGLTAVTHPHCGVYSLPAIPRLPVHSTPGHQSPLLLSFLSACLWSDTVLSPHSPCSGCCTMTYAALSLPPVLGFIVLAVSTTEDSSLLAPPVLPTIPRLGVFPQVHSSPDIYKAPARCP